MEAGEIATMQDKINVGYAMMVNSSWSGIGLSCIVKVRDVPRCTNL